MPLAALLLAVGGCSKPPGEHVYDAANAVTTKLFSNLAPKDATRETAGLIAKLKAGPECEQYRRRLTEAGKGPPADGATQHAIVWTYKEAGDAGCVSRP